MGSHSPRLCPRRAAWKSAKTAEACICSGSARRASIAQLLEEGRKQILLNLSGLVYLDSTGIGDLMHTYMSVIKCEGEMKVLGLTDKVGEILKITQWHQVFPEF
jgi:anti-sigma B factor antagonist